MGDEATLFLISGESFLHEGKTYTGQTILVARTADHALSISVLTSSAPADVERVKELARILLQ